MILNKNKTKNKKNPNVERHQEVYLCKQQSSMIGKTQVPKRFNRGNEAKIFSKRDNKKYQQFSRLNGWFSKDKKKQ